MAEDLFEKWSKKLGIAKQKLVAKKEEIKGQLRSIYPNRDEAFYEQRAMAILGSKIAPLLRTRAKPFVAVCLGFSRIVDLTAGMVATAKQLYATDPEKAIAAGITDPDGTPLDTREKIGGRRNPRYGRPLLPAPARTVILYGREWKTQENKLMLITLTRGKEKFVPKIGETYGFRANVREDRGNYLILNQSTVTQFVPVSATIDINEALNNFPFKVKLIELEQWHEEHREDKFRVCLVEGDVVRFSKEVSPMGSRTLMLGDIMENPELTVSCFVPEHIEPVPEGSRVRVIARTRLGRDLETGERTRVLLDVYGLVPLFEMKEEIQFDILELEEE